MSQSGKLILKGYIQVIHSRNRNGIRGGHQGKGTHAALSTHTMNPITLTPADAGC